MIGLGLIGLPCIGKITTQAAQSALNVSRRHVDLRIADRLGKIVDRTHFQSPCTARMIAGVRRALQMTGLHSPNKVGFWTRLGSLSTTMTKHSNGFYGKRGAKYKWKSTLIVEYAKKLIVERKPVTHAAIMTMLDKERPGHRTYPTEISRALKKTIPKAKRARSGYGVNADGAVYPSVRAAARAKDISMETVRKRIVNPNFPKWKRID
jgi:hypothetical protein